jgi:FlaA1/EpsC-like NDP-sugar epimerase
MEVGCEYLSIFKKKVFKTVKTLIIGKNEETEEFISKLRRRIDSDYDVVGYVSTDGNPSDKFIGNLNNINDVIVSYKINNIVFAKSELTNQLILDLMWKLKDLI